MQRGEYEKYWRDNLTYARSLLMQHRVQLRRIEREIAHDLDMIQQYRRTMYEEGIKEQNG